MKIQTAFAEVNGTRLYYERAGAGNPLVLLHGFTLDTRMWDDQFEPFAQHADVIRYDLRGFGKSALPTELPYNHADDLNALLNSLEIVQADVVGLSKGGAVAADFALDHPDRVRSLILVDTVLGGFQWSNESNWHNGRVWEVAQTGGIPAAKAAWLEHPLFRPAHEKPALAARLRQIVEGFSGWHFVNRNPEHGSKPPAITRLDAIRAPVLIILGERDMDDFRAIADTLAQKIPGARKAVLPGVGHMANMEAPEQFNQIVSRFLAEL